jgi:tRNA G18 (ribose-2'-O)-methylase SpoU
MVTGTALEDLRPALAGHPDVPVYVVPPPVMNEIAGFNIHRGCLALGVRPEWRDWRDLARDARRLVILERIGDADNVGSLFRHAAAFGVDAILIDPATTDPLYRKAIRTSMGAALAIPFSRIAGRPGPSLSAAAPGAQADGPGEWPHALRELGRDGVAVVALTPSSSAPCLRTVAAELTGRRVALVLGHEGDGLTEAALGACEFRARIPVAPGVDSLNVAAAGAIGMYEFSGEAERSEWEVS